MQFSKTRWISCTCQNVIKFVKNVAGNTLNTDAHTTEPRSGLGDSSGAEFIFSSRVALGYFPEQLLCSTMLKAKRRITAMKFLNCIFFEVLGYRLLTTIHSIYSQAKTKWGIKIISRGGVPRGRCWTTCQRLGHLYSERQVVRPGLGTFCWELPNFSFLPRDRNRHAILKRAQEALNKLWRQGRWLACNSATLFRFTSISTAIM